MCSVAQLLAENNIQYLIDHEEKIIFKIRNVLKRKNNFVQARTGGCGW